MSFIPIGQKRLTNIAIVRIKKAGKRFEIACYKNTVLAWRKRVETDINEVVQATTIFANVGKGILAKDDDKMKAFGTLDDETICRHILDKGDLQVSEKERKVEYDAIAKDVATILVEKCINPETSRPYTIGIIERGMKDVHFAVDPKRSAKQQALELIPRLQDKFPIERARMRVRVQVPSHSLEALNEILEKEKAHDLRHDGEAAGGGAEASIICDIEPGSFRVCDQTARGLGGRLEVVSLAVVEEGESTAEFGTHGAGGAIADDGGEVFQQFATMVVAPRAATENPGGFVGGTAAAVAPAMAAAAVAPPTIAGGGGGGGGGAKTEGKFKCITCQGAFADRNEHRDHFKSDWHRRNLKRKVEGEPPLSKEEAENDPMFGEETSDLHHYER